MPEKYQWLIKVCSSSYSKDFLKKSDVLSWYSISRFANLTCNESTGGGFPVNYRMDFQL